MGGQLHLGGGGGVGVGERRHGAFHRGQLAVDDLEILRGTGQSAGAVVGDGHDHLVHGGVVGDAGNAAGVLGDGVNVVTGGIEGENRIAEGGGGAVAGDNGLALVAGRQRGVALAGQGELKGVVVRPVAAGQGFADLEQRGGRGRVGVGGVGVGERRHGALHGGRHAVDDPVIPGGAGQSAGAVIGDGHDHLVHGGVVGDAGNAAGVLGDGVNVLTGGVEGENLIAEGGGGAAAGDSGRALFDGRQGLVALLAGQGEGEGVVVRPVAAGQRFADLEQRGGRGLVGGGGVGVGKGGAVGAAAVGHGGLQGAVFVAHRDGGRHRLVNGNAGNLRGLLGDGVTIGTHLLVGDGAERGLVALGAALDRNGGVTGRHGGILLTGEGEGEGVAVLPVAAFQVLGQLQGGRGGGRGVGVLKHHGGVVAAALKEFPAAIVLLDIIGDAGVGVGVFHQGDVHLGQILGVAVNHVGIAAGHFLDGVPVGFADVGGAVDDVAEGDLAAGRVGGVAALGGRHGGLGGDGLVQVVHGRTLQREAELAVGQPGCAGVVHIALEGLEVDHFIVRVEGVGEGSHVAIRGVRGAILLHDLL